MRTFKSNKATASWRSYRLKDFCEKRTTKNVDKKYSSVLTNSAIYGVIKQEEYFEKEVANDENTGTYYIVNPKDFIYNPRISENAPYGPIRANETGETGIVSPLYFVFGISDPTDVDFDFLKYYFTSSNWHQYIYSIGNNGARCDRMNVADADFMNMTMNLPPLAEQKRIAEILGCCDRMIALKKELIAEKKKQKKALMQKLLNPDSGFRLPGFKGEWTVLTLCNVGKTYSGLSGKTAVDFEKGNSLFIPYLNIFENAIVDETRLEPVEVKNSESQNLVKYGDIFFTSSSETPEEVGMTSVLLTEMPNTYLNSFCFGFRLDNFEELLPFFAAYYLRSNYMRATLNNLAQGATRYNISKTMLMKSQIKIPPTIAEQQAIANILSAADKEIVLLEQELEQQQQKKKSLMQLLLTGIVKV